MQRGHITHRFIFRRTITLYLTNLPGTSIPQKDKHGLSPAKGGSMGQTARPPARVHALIHPCMHDPPRGTVTPRGDTVSTHAPLHNPAAPHRSLQPPPTLSHKTHRYRPRRNIVRSERNTHLSLPPSPHKPHPPLSTHRGTPPARLDRAPPRLHRSLLLPLSPPHHHRLRRRLRCRSHPRGQGTGIAP